MGKSIKLILKRSTKYARLLTIGILTLSLLMAAFSTSRDVFLEQTANSITPSAVEFSPDGSYLAAGYENGTILLLSSNDLSLLGVLQGHVDEVLDLAFSQDGSQLASTSWGNTVIIWDLLTLTEHTRINSVWAYSLVYLNNDFLYTNSFETIFVFETIGYTQTTTLSGHTDSVFDLAISSDSKFLASASWDDTAKIWNLTDNTEVITLVGHTDNVVTVDFSNDTDYVVTGSWDGSSKFWHRTSGILNNTFGDPITISTRGVKFWGSSYDISVGASDLFTWDPISNNSLSNLDVSPFVNALDLYGEKAVLGVYLGSLILWDSLTNGQIIHTFWDDGTIQTTMSFSETLSSSSNPNSASSSSSNSMDSKTVSDSSSEMNSDSSRGGQTSTVNSDLSSTSTIEQQPTTSTNEEVVTSTGPSLPVPLNGAIFIVGFAVLLTLRRKRKA